MNIIIAKQIIIIAKQIIIIAKQITLIANLIIIIAKKNMRLCQNAGTTFFYAQSPDFPKPRLCYYPKFM